LPGFVFFGGTNLGTLFSSCLIELEADLYGMTTKRQQQVEKFVANERCSTAKLVRKRVHAARTPAGTAVRRESAHLKKEGFNLFNV
jgi:hypothetical protein